MSETQIAEPKTEQPTRKAYVRPNFQVAQSQEAYTVTVQVPGVAKEDVKITVDKDVLSIEAQRQNGPGENWNARHREIPTADYRLQLNLSDVAVDADKISANTANGVLTIELPVAEAAKPRQITVN